jgi:hypothetical protein
MIGDRNSGIRKQTNHTSSVLANEDCNSLNVYGRRKQGRGNKTSIYLFISCPSIIIHDIRQVIYSYLVIIQ